MEIWVVTVKLSPEILWKVLKQLVNKSAYFVMSPLPEGEYELTIKGEDEKWVRKLINKR